MRIHTLSCSSLEQLDSSLLELKNNKQTFSLAITFCAPTFDLERLTKLFDKYNLDVFGCSSAGELLNNKLLDDAITVMLLDIDKSYYSIRLEKTTHNIIETAANLAKTATQTFSQPALLLLSGGITVDGEDIIKGIKTHISDTKIPVFGGLAGDNLNMRNTVIFNQKTICNDGLIALIFDNQKVEVEGVAASGWKPLGATNVVTHAEGNILYSINGEPAIHVFNRYFGSYTNPGEGKELTTISAQYPLQIDRSEGYSVMRAPMIANYEDGSLWLAGGVKNGDNFRFSMSPGFETIDSTVADLSFIRDETKPEADALILFSCVGRRAAFGPMLEDEIEQIYNQWNKKPLIGFLTYGEIGNVQGEDCDFHNETCCLVAIRMK